MNNEHIRYVASPMVVTEWAVVSRQSERKKKINKETYVDDEGCLEARGEQPV